MTEMSKKQLESMRERFPKGTRIQCLEYKDGIAVPTGEEGMLDYISETGLFHCDLDDGRRFIAAISEGSFRVIPTITEVNKDTFWMLIAQAKEHPGGPSEWLMERLMDMGPEQAKKFDDIACTYTSLAYQYGLWTAASVMERGDCSDDGFIDFRGWLIAQGREVYMAALKDPDSLADAPNYQDQRFVCLPHMGERAYEELPGQEIYENFDPARYDTLKAVLKQDIVYGDGIGYPYDAADAQVYLPRLCQRYMPEGVSIGAWNLTSLEIRAARATAQKSKKIKKDRGDSR